MSDARTPSAIERYAAIVVGAVLLLLSASLFGWGIRLTVAALMIPAGWPPGLEKLLLPIMGTALFVGFGSWRLLLIGLPEQIRGISLSWVVIAAFCVAGLIGAAI